MGRLLMSTELVAVARDVSASAHAGQVDKIGRPYVEHPARVAARVSGDAEAEAVAWLHDVVEDSTLTDRDLRERGFPTAVVEAVLALTRQSGQDLDDYYARVAGNPLALVVKRADIADNTAPERVAALDPETRARLVQKYRHAVAKLEQLSPAGTADPPESMPGV